MPKKTLRGISTGIVASVALLLSVWAATAAARSAGPATLTVQVDLDDETRQLLSDAESLMGRGQADQAFALLAAHEFELAGNPLYDYLLGVSALDSGRYGEAIFSLQRTLDVEPDFSGARMALARAYYENGEKAQARALFMQLLGEQPPPAVRQAVNQYLAAMDRRPAPKSRFSPFFETVVGYDSNANASTDDGTFLGFNLTPNSIGTSSPYAAVGAGIDWFKRSSQQSAWYARLRGGYRDNPDASFVNAFTASGRTGFAWRKGSFFGRAGLDAYWGARDGHYNEKYSGADVELGQRLGDRWDITANVRYGAQRYVSNIDILDVNRMLYSVGLRRRFAENTRVRLEFIGGDDSEQIGGSPYGNTKAGGRISIDAALSANVRLFGSYGQLETEYDSLFFGVPREDEQETAIIQFEFRGVMSPSLTIVPRILYVDYDSDINLYRYDRTEVGVIFRWSPK